MPTMAAAGLKKAELHGASVIKDSRIAHYERCQVRWASDEEACTRFGRYGKEVTWKEPTEETAIRARNCAMCAPSLRNQCLQSRAGISTTQDTVTWRWLSR